MTDQHIQHTTDPQVAFANQRANALRTMADLIEAKPELAGEHSNLRILVAASDAEEMSRLVQRLGGARTKEVVGGDYLSVVRDFGAHVALEVYGRREQVCEAVVVGTETVEIPDPAVVIPTVTVERPVVEWRCSPILTNSIGLADARASLTGAQS